MIKVSIIEDDKEYRQGLVNIIESSDKFLCLNQSDSCEYFIKNFKENKPDVILLDIELPPGMSGTVGAKLLKKTFPSAEIIMLTVHEDSGSVFKSLANGATGYLLKNISPENLVAAIEEVVNGGSPMSMQIARMITESFRKNKRTEELTEREQEVLNLLRDGKSYQAIANKLFISKSTVKFHIKNIYRKLHVLNKYEAIMKS